MLLIASTNIFSSAREKEIHGLVKEGRTSKEIGEKLCLSKHTVDTHRRKIGRKLKMGLTSVLFTNLTPVWLWLYPYLSG